MDTCNPWSKDCEWYRGNTKWEQEGTRGWWPLLCGVQCVGYVGCGGVSLFGVSTNSLRIYTRGSIFP